MILDIGEQIFRFADGVGGLAGDVEHKTVVRVLDFNDVAVLIHNDSGVGEILNGEGHSHSLIVFEAGDSNFAALLNGSGNLNLAVFLVFITYGDDNSSVGKGQFLSTFIIDFHYGGTGFRSEDVCGRHADKHDSHKDCQDSLHRKPLFLHRPVN